METTDLIFLVIVGVATGAPLLWYLWLSPMARSTNELAILNRIWEKFNSKEYTSEETRLMLAKHKWKFHKDKVELLKTFTEVVVRTYKP